MGSYEPRGAAAGAGVPRPLVFVVEDEEDIARLISHNLQAAGFHVQSFVNGASVVSEALRETPSLFLLDVMLPGADGFEICRQIRQTASLSATPIIFLTAKTAEADRVKGLELGGDDYITKPFSPRELVARVRSVLRGVRQPAEVAGSASRGGTRNRCLFDDRAGAGQDYPNHRARVSLAGISRDSPGPRAHTGPIARCRMEGDALCDASFHRRLRPATAREN